MIEQRTPEWYRARLGHVTASMVSNIMGTPRKKDETFTDTAKSYLYGIAAERNISELYRDQRFDEWLERTNVQTYAMRYGIEMEQAARTVYECSYLPSSQHVEEVGFIEYIPGLYGDSPDGIVLECEKKVGCIEIKCPTSATWAKYKHLFAQGKTLKEIEDKYYWQCQSHIMCTETDWCDFIFFDKMMNDPLQVVRIPRDNDDIQLLQDRIQLAAQFLSEITDNATQE